MLAPLLLLVPAAVLFNTSAASANTNCAVQRSILAPDGEEAALLRRINDDRAQAGLSTLSVSQTLTAAAAWKSADLGANAYFAHDDLSRGWAQRLRDCGYTATPNIAENLAAGDADGASTFQVWARSAGHNANLLNPAMRVIGVARAYTPGSPYGWYWTAEFGATVDGGANSATLPVASAAALFTGATAVVSGTGDCLRVHSAPQLSTDTVTCLKDGAAMVVSAGPVQTDGYTWWQIGNLGWAAGQYLSAGP